MEFLIYSLIDAIVDCSFPIVKSYGEHLEEIEFDLTEEPDDRVKSETVRKINRELLFLRRMLRPMREVVEKLINPIESRYMVGGKLPANVSEDDEKNFHFSSGIRTCLQDVEDNLSRIIDLIDTYKEICQSLVAMHCNAQELKQGTRIFVENSRKII